MDWAFMKVNYQVQLGPRVRPLKDGRLHTFQSSFWFARCRQSCQSIGRHCPTKADPPMQRAASSKDRLVTMASLEDVVCASYPEHPMGTTGNEALSRIRKRSSAVNQVSIEGGCLSIAPEKLLRPLSQQVPHSGRSKLRPTVPIHDSLGCMAPSVRALSTQCGATRHSQ